MDEKEVGILLERQNSLHDKVDRLIKTLDLHIADENSRLRSLENWRSFLVGGGAVVMFMVGVLGWKQFFGG